MDTGSSIFIGLLAGAFTLFILYWIIRSAVKSAIIDADWEIDHQKRLKEKKALEREKALKEIK